MNVDISDMRISYDEKSLTEESLVAKEPFSQFEKWLDEACKTKEIIEPHAVCLATSTKDGRPSCRMVILKGFDKRGFKYLTNYDSRKGRELDDNPFAALTFFWSPLYRSVRIEGTVEKMSEQESISYFNNRTRDAQIAASISQQSGPIAGKQALDEKFSLLAEMYPNEADVIPKPANWGGYLVVPDVIEFWQGQKNRMHDRIRFRKPTSSDVIDNKVVFAGDDGWIFERLSP